MEQTTDKRIDLGVKIREGFSRRKNAKWAMHKECAGILVDLFRETYVANSEQWLSVFAKGKMAIIPMYQVEDKKHSYEYM